MVFVLVVDAVWVIVCLVLAARKAAPLRGRWLAEAGAFTALFFVIRLANPAMSPGLASIFIPAAGFAAYALWFAVAVGPEGAWFGRALVAIGVTWGIVFLGVAAGHSARQNGITDRDRATQALGGQKVDRAQNHVPILWVEHPPAVADSDVPETAGPTAEKIERSVFGPGKLTMVVDAAASCEAAVVVIEDQTTTLDVMVVFERSPFLSPAPVPSGTPLCRPSGPSSTVAVQIDLPSTTTATTLRDASQP